jgi:hypothetical protein
MKITIYADGEQADHLRSLAKLEKIHETEVLARALNAYTTPPAVHPPGDDVSIEVGEILGGRITDRATTCGESPEQVITEAIDFYPPAAPTGTLGWIGLGALAVIVIAGPLLLMFLSPSFEAHPATHQAPHPASAWSWLMFSVAMLICYCGLFGLVLDTLWGGVESALRFGPVYLVFEIGVGIAAIISAFAYIYWQLDHTVSNFFTSSLSRVDAVALAINTFTSSGTGNLQPKSDVAILLVAGQGLLSLGVIAVLLAIVVTRGLAEYRRRRAQRASIVKWTDS